MESTTAQAHTGLSILLRAPKTGRHVITVDFDVHSATEHVDGHSCDMGRSRNLTLADRRIVCPRCGYTADRDVHAARNMLVFAQDANNIKVGQGLSEFTLVESAFPAHDRKIMGKWRSMKQEATLL